MPPEITAHSCYPLVTPKTPFLSSRGSPESNFKPILHQGGGGGGRMKCTKWKLIPILLLILTSASIFRFLKITMITTRSSLVSLPFAALPPILDHDCSDHPLSSACMRDNVSHVRRDSTKGHRPVSFNHESSIAEKEMGFLMKFFSFRVPCNLLVFGLEYQYSSIESLNVGGVTIFITDEYANHTAVKSSNHTEVYKIKYDTLASEAYNMLKDARKNPYCMPKFDHPNELKCNLALLNLPQRVHDIKWDTIIVDGPDGGSPDSPGRMAAIYTAGMLARRGNWTHVLVHDVDRMVEKWFSWEFLCEENLVSSKGRFWHFQVLGLGNATSFCTT